MKCPDCNKHFQFKNTNPDNGLEGKWYCDCSIVIKKSPPEDWEQRYNAFRNEYESLCEKYQMEFAIADIWETGSYSIEVYDTKEKSFIY